MIDDEIEDDSERTRFTFRDETVTVGHRTVFGVNGLVVGDVVALSESQRTAVLLSAVEAFLYAGG